MRPAWPVRLVLAVVLGLGFARLMLVPEVRIHWSGDCVARSVEEYRRLLEGDGHHPWEAAPDLGAALAHIREQLDRSDRYAAPPSVCDCDGEVAIRTPWIGEKWQGYASDGRLAWAVQATDFAAYCGRRTPIMRFGPPPEYSSCTCARVDATILDDPDLRAAVPRGDAAALVRLIARGEPTEEDHPLRFRGLAASLSGAWPWEQGAGE